MDNCPVGVKVREFVQLIVAGDFAAAANKIREDNVLPAITGRVCTSTGAPERGSPDSAAELRLTTVP